MVYRLVLASTLMQRVLTRSRRDAAKGRVEETAARLGYCTVDTPINGTLPGLNFEAHPERIRALQMTWNQGPSANNDHPLELHAKYQLFEFDVDAKTSTTITSFSGVAGLATAQYVRVAARYQQDGTLVATRVWASSSFDEVWLSPEGHVLQLRDGGALRARQGGEQGVQPPVVLWFGHHHAGPP